MKVSSHLQPLFQAILVFAGTLSFMAILNDQEKMPWMVMGVGMLFFTAVNPILGIFIRKWKYYLALSYVVYILVYGGLWISAAWFSHIPLSDLYEYRSLLWLLPIFYIVLTLLVLLYRGVLIRLTQI